MYIPQTGRKKALIIVDVQKTFILERNKYILPKIVELIEKWSYETIIYTVQYNTQESLWHKQIGWKEEIKESDTIEMIKNALKWKTHVYKTKKLSRSAFKWEKDLSWYFKFFWIEEVHICGYESNDCVFATAQESFDLWFYTFVIEEATETGTTSVNHTKAIEILRYLNLTNNSNYVGKK